MASKIVHQKCRACNGEGYDPYTYEECYNCDGNGEVERVWRVEKEDERDNS